MLRPIMAFLVAFAAGVVVTAPNRGTARWARRSPGDCNWNDRGFSGTDMEVSETFKGLINFGDETDTVNCAIDDTNSTPKTAIATLNVHGYEGSTTGEVEVKVCYFEWDVSGGSCTLEGLGGAGQGDRGV